VDSDLLELTPEVFYQNPRIDPVLEPLYHSISGISYLNFPLKDSFIPLNHGFPESQNR
jgi:hypothetical protein